MKKCLGILFLSFSLQAMELVESPSLHNETTWLVHGTRMFPKDGRIIAGAMLSIKFRQSDESKASLKELYEQASHSSTALKNSVHWSINSLVYPKTRAIDSIAGSQVLILDEKPYPYVIIEPLKAFNDTPLYGYWQDVYHLGGHQLSPEAMILVPSDDVEYKQFVGRFTGTISEYEYDTEVRDAVESLLMRKGAPVLYPSMKGLTRIGGNWYHHHGLSQSVIIDATEHTSQEISALLELDNTLLERTPLGKLQHLLMADLRVLRGTQLLEFLRTRLLPLEDMFDTKRCVACKRTKKKKSSKKLLICKKCNLAFYCSKECRSAHHAFHAKNCGTHRSFLVQMGLLHQQYLNTLKVVNHEEHMQDISQLVEALKRSHVSASEEEILTTYDEYLRLLLAILYSIEPEYVRIRAFFKVGSLPGFIGFVKEVRYMLSHFESFLGKTKWEI